MDKRERDLNKKQSQYETAKTNITLLEAKVKELQEEKRILQIRMESAIHDHTATPNVNIPGNDNIPQSSERSENRSLLEKLNNMENKMWENRVKDAEKETMVMRMKILEDRLTLQNQTPPTHVDNELIMMRIHPKVTHLQQQWIPPSPPYIHQHPQGWLPPMPYNPHLLSQLNPQPEPPQRHTSNSTYHHQTKPHTPPPQHSQYFRPNPPYMYGYKSSTSKHPQSQTGQVKPSRVVGNNA